MPAWIPNPAKADELEAEMEERQARLTHFYSLHKEVLDQHDQLQAALERATEDYNTYMGWVD